MMLLLGESGEDIIYGTSDGKVGLVQIGRYLLVSLTTTTSFKL